MIERLEYDRPLMLKEKLDIIWNEGQSHPYSSDSDQEAPTTLNL